MIIFCAPFFINAQRFYGGLTGGINMSQVDGDSNSGYNKLGSYFGAIIRTDIFNEVGIETGVQFSSKGSSFEKNLSKKRIILRYIEVPVLVNYLFNSRFRVGGGTMVGYLVSSQLKENSYVYPDWTYGYKNFDIALVGRLTALITNKLEVDVKLSYSIISITDHDNYSEQFNKVLSLGLIYQIGNDF